MPDVDFIAAYERATGASYVPPRKPRHPEPGCPCAECVERDDRLEDLAQRRAEDRRGY